MGSKIHYDIMQPQFLEFFRLLEEDHEGTGQQTAAVDEKHSRGSPISFHPTVFNFKERYVPTYAFSSVFSLKWK